MIFSWPIRKRDITYLLPGFLCGAMSLFGLGHSLKLPGSLVVPNGFANNSPVFHCNNMGFDYEIYSFRFFNISHFIGVDISTVSPLTNLLKFFPFVERK